METPEQKSERLMEEKEKREKKAEWLEKLRVTEEEMKSLKDVTTGTRKTTTDWSDKKVLNFKYDELKAMNIEQLKPWYVAYIENLDVTDLPSTRIGTVVKVLITHLPSTVITSTDLLFAGMLEGNNFATLEIESDEKKTETMRDPTVTTETTGREIEIEPEEGEEEAFSAVVHGEESGPQGKPGGKPQWMQDLLDGLNDKSKSRDVRAILSYHALVTLRTCVKSNSSIITYMTKGFEKVASNVMNLQTHPKVPAPSNKFLDHVRMDLAKGKNEFMNLMKLILKKYVVCSPKITDDLAKAEMSVLEAGILVHTKGNGLGIFYLLYLVAEMTGKPLSDVAQMNLTSTTYNSLVLCKNFITTYLKESSLQISAWWCRVIDDTQWMDLRIRKNHVLSARLAGILAVSNPGIWDGIEMKKLIDLHRASATRWADIFWAEVKGEIDEEESAGTSKKILDKFKKKEALALERAEEIKQDLVEVEEEPE